MAVSRFNATLGTIVGIVSVGATIYFGLQAHQDASAQQTAGGSTSTTPGASPTSGSTVTTRAAGPQVFRLIATMAQGLTSENITFTYVPNETGRPATLTMNSSAPNDFVDVEVPGPEALSYSMEAVGSDASGQQYDVRSTGTVQVDPGVDLGIISVPQNSFLGLRQM